MGWTGIRRHSCPFKANNLLLHKKGKPSRNLAVFSHLYVCGLVRAEAGSLFDERFGILKICYIQVLVRMMWYPGLDGKEIRGPRSLLRFLNVSLFYRRTGEKAING
jgi:hypothetical protein